LKQLEATVARIDAAAERLVDDRQRTILECIMEGERMNRIAQHIGVSRQRLHELKLELVRRLAEDIFGVGRQGAS
jgi:DNA-binding NarL/FixJ family response regulator